MDLMFFKESEFDCEETGENQMEPIFLYALDELRRRCGFPFKVNSGYRSPEHSKERKKASPGTHVQGIAADIRVSNGAERFLIVEAAMDMGFTGIGVAKTFIHVDIRDTTPVVWTY